MGAAIALVNGDGGQVDEAAAAAMGLVIDEPQPGALEIWPENENIVRVFMAMATQWNVGMAGAIGLRYESLPAVMRYCRVPGAEQPATFAGLRVMERAALEEMNRGR